MLRRTVLLVAFACLGARLALASIHLAYECRRRVVVLPTHVVVISVTCSCWRAVAWGVVLRVCAYGGRAHREGEAGAVCAGSVVALCGEEGQLGFVSVDEDEDGVFFPPVPDVVFVVRVFDAGVHDAGGVVASVERAGDMIPAVCAAAAPFIGFHGEGGVVVEGEGGGECVAVIVHVGEGDVGDVAAFQEARVFFCRAVLVECGGVVQAVGGGVHGWFFSLRLLVVMSARGGACVGAVSSWPSSSRMVCSRRSVIRRSRSTRSLCRSSRRFPRS